MMTVPLSESDLAAAVSHAESALQMGDQVLPLNSRQVDLDGLT